MALVRDQHSARDSGVGKSPPRLAGLGFDCGARAHGGGCGLPVLSTCGSNTAVGRDPRRRLAISARGGFDTCGGRHWRKRRAWVVGLSTVGKRGVAADRHDRGGAHGLRCGGPDRSRRSQRHYLDDFCFEVLAPRKSRPGTNLCRRRKLACTFWFLLHHAEYRERYAVPYSRPITKGDCNAIIAAWRASPSANSRTT
jgi:hypothetical protein